MSAWRPSIINASVQNTITFIDGDIVLRSKDGVDFTVDTIVLQRASEFFRDLFATLGTTSKPLVMEEDSKMLDMLLRLLYPISKPPPPLTEDHAPEFISMVEKFGIQSHVVEAFIDVYFATCHPLKGWALAVRFNRAANHTACARRYFMTNGGENASRFPELDDISARAFANLKELHETTRDSAKNRLAVLPWTCKAHRGEDWWEKRMKEIEKHPFDESKSSDDVLGAIIKMADCHGCSGRFNHTGYNRQVARQEVERMLDRAADRA
ncbi:hypothetical protein DL93DRAFT_765606 [Clavulina sp. PMI_390]|nr:hypothetical protein DL93DRAFT_765606 [Clavulina sp. PMI_390]